MREVPGKIIWSVNRVDKCLIIFVEGYTEIEFYKKIIEEAKQHRTGKTFNTYIEYENVKGVGGFKNNALRKFIKSIKLKYDKNCEFNIALCRDTDIFEIAEKPPIDWKSVEKAFYDNGAQKVIHIKAKRCIEDWFLYDLDGILDFLHLPKNTKPNGGNGCEKHKSLFRKVNKIYYKDEFGNEYWNGQLIKSETPSKEELEELNKLLEEFKKEEE